MKYLKWLATAIVVIVGFIYFISLEEETKHWIATMGFIVWLYWSIKESIEEKYLAINRRLDYIQDVIERSRNIS